MPLLAEFYYLACYWKFNAKVTKSFCIIADKKQLVFFTLPLFRKEGAGEIFFAHQLNPPQSPFIKGG